MENSNLENQINNDFTKTQVSEESYFNYYTIIKIILLVGISFFLIYNLYHYYYHGTHIFGNIFPKDLEKNSDSIKKKIIDDNDNLLNKKYKKNKLDKKLKYKKSSSSVKADNSKSNIQNKKDKYCYVGTENGKRTCVQIDDSTKCLSGKIFKNRESCVYKK